MSDEAGVFDALGAPRGTHGMGIAKDLVPYVDRRKLTRPDVQGKLDDLDMMLRKGERDG